MARYRSSLGLPVASLVFFITSSAFRYLAFSQTPYANGWDGYFYINQVRSFIEEVKMDVPDVSLIYPLMMLIQLFTHDYVLSYKLLACILAGSFTLSLFLLATKWSKDHKVAMVLASASLFSPHLTYFAAQYPKNLLGAILFIWLLYTTDFKNRIVPILLLALNFFGHRATAVLGFIYVLINTVLRKAKGLVPYILILFVTLFVAGGLFLPGVLNSLDIERFQGILSGRPQFAPYSFFGSFGTELIPVWWLIEIVICCLAFLVALVYAIRLIIHRNYDIQLMTVLLILSFLIFPFFRWSIDGPAFRFFLIFILLCPLVLIFMLRSSYTEIAEEAQSFAKFSLRPLRGLCALCVIVFLLLICSFFSYKSYNPDKHDPPYSLYDIVSKQALSSVTADSVELIIAHKALAEYIVFSTGVDAMSWIPEYDISPTRLWRIAGGVKDVQLYFYLDPDDQKFIHRLTPSYCLIREDYWNKFLQRLRERGDEELIRDLTNWKNPDRVRPGFLMKNR